MRVSGSVLFVLLLSVVRGGKCDGLTPVLAWSNSDALSGVAQGNSQTVREMVEQMKMEAVERVIVFSAPKLSFDGLMKYGAVYGEREGPLDGLQGYLHLASSSYWNGVEGSPISDLKKEFGGMITVVELPEATDEHGFVTHDATIRSTMAEVEREGVVYVAVYTADNDDKASRHRREVNGPQDGSLGADDQSRDCQFSHVFGVDDSPCMIVCLNQFSFQDENGTYIQIGNYSFTNPSLTDTYNCTSADDQPLSSSFFTLNFAERDDKDISCGITFTFPLSLRSPGFWSMTLDLDCSLPNTSHTYTRDTSRFLYYPFKIPFDLSYTCSNDSGYNSFTSNETDVVVQIASIQVQPYYVKYRDDNDNIVFASSYNCQGYFTTASWMGIFTILIFMLLLYMSIVFMFNIQTLDRFDDPKDPTITIDNLH